MAKAKRCIFILPEGGPSHLDLFDPKPKLSELHGQKLPESLVERVRFAFIKKETAVLAGSQYFMIRDRTRTGCFKAFLHNNWVGAVIFAGIAADYALRP